MRKLGALCALTFAVLTAHAQQKINPSSQVNWPTNCGSNGTMVYNKANNTCIDAAAQSAHVPSTSAVLKGDGTGNAAAATPGTDYVVPSGTVAAATHLVADPSTCGTGQSPEGVDKYGAPINCHAASGSGLSGQTTNYYPKANSSTTSTGPGLISDDGTTIHMHGPVDIDGVGGGGAFLDFLIGTDPGAHSTGYVRLKSPATGTGYDMVLPASNAVGALMNNGSGVLSWNPAAGGGGLSSQSINYLPRATSATASAAASRFFDDPLSYAGVTTAFQFSASAPNCGIAAGPTFTKWTCNTVTTSDNGSMFGLTGSNPNLAAFTITHNAWGGHTGAGGAESRTSQVFGDSFNGALVTAGIKQAWVSNTSAFGIGDFAAMQNDHLCITGVAYGSDEGCKNYFRIGETANPWSGVITGGTNTAPTFTSSGGCFGLENQACAPSPGSWMIDSTVGRGSGHATGLTTGPVSWVSKITTDFAPPAAGAWCSKVNANLTPTTSWELPVSQTFTCEAGAGTFAVNDHACVIGSSFTEQNIISAVSGSSPTQTITIPLAMPETSVLIAKGDCMAMSTDADAAVGVQYAIPAVSLDGSTLLASWENYSRNDALTWPAGVHWSKMDGGSTSGIHLYATSRITMVSTADPSAAWAPQNILVYLQPNSYFNVGDNLISAHYNAQLVTGLDVNAIQAMSGGPRGVMSHIGGHGTNGDAYAFYGENTEPSTSYVQYGGPLNEPIFMHDVGVFDTMWYSNYTPQTNGFYFNNHQAGQTSYNIWRDPSWGILSLQSDGLHWNNDIHSGSYYSTGLVGATLGLQAGASGVSSGSFGTKYTFGNGSTAPMYIAAEYALGNTNNHMAVTSHAETRTAGGGDYYAAPDGTLDLSTLNGTTVNGTTVNSTTTNTATLSATSSITTPSLSVSDAYTGTGFDGPMSLFAPSAGNGAHIGFFFGQGYSNSNSCYTSFHFLSSGSSSNGISLGCFAHDDLFTINMAGNAAVAGDLTVGGSGVCTAGNGRCATGTTSSTVASAEVVTFSATPTFSTAYNVSRITLTGNITSFTLGAGADGQTKTLCFKQGAGPYTVSPPANYKGFFSIGTTNGGWNCQSGVYDATDAIWLANSLGVTNE